MNCPFEEYSHREVNQFLRSDLRIFRRRIQLRFAFNLIRRIFYQHVIKGKWCVKPREHRQNPRFAAFVENIFTVGAEDVVMEHPVALNDDLGRYHDGMGVGRGTKLAESRRQEVTVAQWLLFVAERTFSRGHAVI
jgi:hypothetical protein